MEKIIRTLNEPTIRIEDLAINSKDYGRYNDKFPLDHDINENVDLVKAMGLRFPLISINGVTYGKDKVLAVRLDLTSKYPTITMSVNPSKVDYTIFGFPKDGDVISILYRSNIDTLKPIRCDFDIVNITPTGREEERIIYGVLRVPKLFSDVSWSYEGNSLSTLQKFAEYLSLGFATNETKTEDEMSWVCPNDPAELFMENTTTHSYKDETSFFESYIDHEYILNFVNVRKQLTNDAQTKIYTGLDKLKDFIETNRNSPYYSENDDRVLHEVPLILTNWAFEPSSINRILAYKELNNTGRVSLEDGYKRYIHHFDVNTNEKFESYTELINSKDTKDYLLMKGRLSEETYRGQNRHSWEGISYSRPLHNTHKFYKYAKQHNYQNIKELDKMKIEVTLASPNFNLYRYMVVPVILYEYGREFNRMFNDPKFDSNSEKVFIPNNEYILNQMLTGFYVIQGMTYEFYGNFGSEPTIVQRLILARTEWNKAVYVPNVGDSYTINAT